jgi:hypothetical protein
MSARGVIAVTMVAACYSPARESECKARCDDGVSCPIGLVCGGDRMCKLAAHADCNNVAGIDASVPSPDASPLNEGLVGWWRLDESPDARTANDSTGNASPGMVLSNTNFATGHIGNAAVFLGSGCGVILGNDAQVNNLQGLTIAAWINPTAGGANMRPIVVKEPSQTSQPGRWELYLDTASNGCTGDAGCLTFRKGFTNTDLFVENGTSIVATGLWQHVAVTWDGSNLASHAHLYKDGVELFDTTAVNGIGNVEPDDGFDMILGDTGDFALPYGGAIDDVRIYNRVLSTTELGVLAAE